MSDEIKGNKMARSEARMGRGTIIVIFLAMKLRKKA
jgi:hypothetical protein